MRKMILAALLCFGLLPVPASAQALLVLPSGCGTGNLSTNVPYLTVDSTGRLCQSPPPSSGQIITGNATGTTGAVVGTLAAAAAKTTYICGFDVSAIGGTAAVGPITVAGLVGSSMVFQLASTATGVTLPVTFSPCLPASAVNTGITITTTADGTASAVSVNSWGYQQ